LLEGDHVIFRGESERVKVSFASLTNIEARQGRLALTSAAGTITLELGDLAERWAEKIRNPRSLLDKLGVKDGMRISVIDVDDGAFSEQLRARCPAARVGTALKDTDIIFYGAENVAALGRLSALKKSLKPNGAIWVVHRKGKGASLKDVEVFAAAKAAGLVDNKVASFSDTHTAERLVIPVKDRASR
jgi:hypothetical protein